MALNAGRNEVSPVTVSETIRLSFGFAWRDRFTLADPESGANGAGFILPFFWLLRGFRCVLTVVDYNPGANRLHESHDPRGRRGVGEQTGLRAAGWPLTRWQGKWRCRADPKHGDIVVVKPSGCRRTVRWLVKRVARRARRHRGAAKQPISCSMAHTADYVRWLQPIMRTIAEEAAALFIFCRRKSLVRA